jgi:phosphoribosylformylglycinamidine synthase PurS subunit
LRIFEPNAKKISRPRRASINIPAELFAGHFSSTWPDMKAKIIITPKKAVLDPQGKTVQNALEHMGYRGIGAVHVGKYLEIELTGEAEAMRKQIDEACHKFLSNPVIEDYRFELE